MIFRNIILMVLIFISNNIFAALTCSNPRTECVEAGGTKYFSGVAVTLGCWRYRTTHECREQSDNNCQRLRNKGCSQISVRCRATVSGSCVVQDRTFRCPIKKCNEIVENVCQEAFSCVGGENTITTIKKGGGDAVKSTLAVIAAVSGETKKQSIANPQIFAGRQMECSQSVDSNRNCCGIDSCGWLDDTILDCSGEEKELARIKAEERAIEVGEYCHNLKHGKCILRHKAYCIFDSKTARIVQNYGRKDQLVISLGDIGGDYANLDCRGVTREELSKMDFNGMDVSSLDNEVVPRDRKFCEEKRRTKCKTTHVDEVCNEEIRTVKRVYEKTPKIDLKEKNVAHPNCQELLAARIGYRSPCPAGYRKLSESKWYTSDGRYTSLGVCVRGNDQTQECFSGGYHTYMCTGSTTVDSGRATVPKKTKARIKVSHFAGGCQGHALVTIINETTGETICSNKAFGSGSVIPLPFSETKEQVFRFYGNTKIYANVQPGQRATGLCFQACRASHLIVLYFDRTYKEKEANIVWEEKSYDI